MSYQQHSCGGRFWELHEQCFLLSFSRIPASLQRFAASLNELEMFPRYEILWNVLTTVAMMLVYSRECAMKMTCWTTTEDGTRAEDWTKVNLHLIINGITLIEQRWRCSHLWLTQLQTRLPSKVIKQFMGIRLFSTPTERFQTNTA